MRFGEKVSTGSTSLISYRATNLHYLISRGKHRRLNTQFNSAVNLLVPYISLFRGCILFRLLLSTVTGVIPITPHSPLTDDSILSSDDTAYPFHYLPWHSTSFVNYSYFVHYIPSSSLSFHFSILASLVIRVRFRSLVPSLFSFIVPATINVRRDLAKPRGQFLLVEIHNRNEKNLYVKQRFQEIEVEVFLKQKE